MNKPKRKKILKIDGSALQSPKHEVIEVFTYEDGRREYLVLTKDKSYKMLTSVTTALPKPPPHVLETWKKKVGEEYAAINTKASSIFGNRMHDSIALLLHENDFTTHDKHSNDYTGHIFEKFLDDVDYVIASELEVVSVELGVAGSFDFLYMSKSGEIVLVDFKNHSRIHPLKDVKSRLLELDQSIQSAKKTKWRKQGACYVKGLKETYSIDVDRFEVWCFNQGTGKVTKPICDRRAKIDKVIAKLPEQLTI